MKYFSDILSSSSVALNFAVTPEKIPVDDITATKDACCSLQPKQANHFRNDIVRALKKSKPQTNHHIKRGKSPYGFEEE